MQICKWLPILVLLFLSGCATHLTPHTQATLDGNATQIESLLKSGHNINEQMPGGDDTALAWAVHQGKLDTVKLLIDKGAQLDIPDKYRNTALMLAAAKGYTEIVKLLTDKGVKLDIQNTFGNTALQLAAYNGHTEIVKLLTIKGAKLDIQNTLGNTALMVASNKGMTEIVRLLIQGGARLDIRDNNGWTALDFANSTKNHTIADMLRLAGSGGSQQPTNPLPPSSGTSPETSTNTGTGWVAVGGYIVTNHHVIEDQVEIKVRFNSVDTKEYPARIVTSDPHNDIAILKLNTPPPHPPKGLPVSSKIPKIGAEVFTVGYPKSSIMGINPKVTNGIISALSGIQDDPRVIQTTVAIQSGNSGGPLMTMNGEVVGVTTSTLRTRVTEKGVDVPQGVNYAVKTAYVTALLSAVESLPAYHMFTGTSTSLEELIPKIQDSIVQVIVKSSK
jgi:ankyrin repeat protein